MLRVTGDIVPDSTLLGASCRHRVLSTYFSSPMSSRMQHTGNIEPDVQHASDEISGLSSLLKTHLGDVTAEKVTAALRSVVELARVRRPSSNVNTQLRYPLQNRKKAKQIALDFVMQGITDLKALVNAVESGGDAEFLKRAEDDLKDMQCVLRHRTLLLLRNTRKSGEELRRWADERSVSRITLGVR
jgi:hypothetical protein